MRAAEDQILNGYGWVDQANGVVRIPIDARSIAGAARPARAAAGEPQSSDLAMSACRPRAGSAEDAAARRAAGRRTEVKTRALEVRLARPALHCACAAVRFGPTRTAGAGAARRAACRTAT